MKRTVTINYEGDEVSYQMMLIIVARQLARGQVREPERLVGNGRYSYEVRTDHQQADDQG